MLYTLCCIAIGKPYKVDVSFMDILWSACVWRFDICADKLLVEASNTPPVDANLFPDVYILQVCECAYVHRWLSNVSLKLFLFTLWSNMERMSTGHLYWPMVYSKVMPNIPSNLRAIERGDDIECFEEYMQQTWMNVKDFDQDNSILP